METRLELNEIQLLNVVETYIKQKKLELDIAVLGKQKQFELLCEKYKLDPRKQYKLEGDKLISVDTDIKKENVIKRNK